MEQKRLGWTPAVQLAQCADRQLRQLAMLAARHVELAETAEEVIDAQLVATALVRAREQIRLLPGFVGETEPAPRTCRGSGGETCR